MSTIVVVRRGTTAVIGADTLSKHGSTKQDAALLVNHSKIIRFGAQRIAMVGAASWGLVLEHYLKGLESLPALDSPEAIFAFANTMHVKLKEQYFLNPKEDEQDEFESSQLSCLIANPSGIYGLYSLRSVDEFARFYALGSGSHYAVGAMHATYARGKSAREVAKAGLEAAVTFDEDTGAPIELRTVRLRGTVPGSR